MKGTSGNKGGRPRRGLAAIDVLIDLLEKKNGNNTIQEGLAKVLVAAALSGDTAAIGKIYNIIQRDYEFNSKTEIEKRLDEIEQRLDEAESEKNKDD